jgi:predicted 2-oxoglutarate/Fe(II)-dependent dioxygenase YbiX
MLDAHRIIIIPNFISDDDLLQISELLDNAEMVKLGVLNDAEVEYSTIRYDAEIKGNIHLPCRTIDTLDNGALYKLLDKSVSRIGAEIEKSFGVDVYPEYGYSITAYVEGDELNRHFDGAENIKTPNGNPQRDISSVLYLNEGFTGGQAVFNFQGIHISPKAGMLLLFPGTRAFAHSVTKIESGLRYIVPQFWAVKNV